MSLFGEKSQTEFYRAYTVSGIEAGLGAKCPVCSGCVRYGLCADVHFTHCGRVEITPTNTRDLPRRSLGTGALPHMGQFVLTTDLEDDAPNSNTGIFENESRFTWT